MIISVSIIIVSVVVALLWEVFGEVIIERMVER